MSHDSNEIHTPQAEAFTNLILETFRFNGLLLAAGDQLTQDLGLSSALWQVLGALGDGPLTVSQIARKMGLTRQSVRRTALLLRDRGFLEFSPNPHHLRAKLASLTPQGSEALGQATALQISWSNRLSEGLSAEKINEAVGTIKKLCERL